MIQPEHRAAAGRLLSPRQDLRRIPGPRGVLSPHQRVSVDDLTGADAREAARRRVTPVAWRPRSWAGPRRPPAPAGSLLLTSVVAGILMAAPACRGDDDRAP